MNLVYSPKNYQNFTNILAQTLNTDISDISQLVHPNLIAPYIIELPYLIKEQADHFVSNITTQLATPYLGGFSPSLDFHWSPEEQNIKLIEANTNAAFMGLGVPLYQSIGGKGGLTSDQILTQFKNITALDHSVDTHTELAIVDTTPTHQGLYIEFLFYQKLFRSLFKEVKIRDPQTLTGQEGYIYNRVTDFFFTEPENKLLLEFWKKNPLKITPNPSDYDLFANKLNIQNWAKTMPRLLGHLAPLEPVTEQNKESLWTKRKSLFFKPNTSFGSKMTYRGSSISKKHYDTLVASGSALAQQFIPAPEIATTEHGNLKFDIRVYFFEGQVTQTLVRLYQGQVTNAKTPGGGFATVRWI